MTRILICISCFISILVFGQKENDVSCSQIAIQRYKGDLDERYPMDDVRYTFDTVKINLGDSGVYEAYSPIYQDINFYWFKYDKPSSTDLDMDLLDDGILDGIVTIIRKKYRVQYEFSNNYIVKRTVLNSKGTKVKNYFSVPVDSEGNPSGRPEHVAFKRIRRTKMVREVVFCNGKYRGRMTPMKIEENE